VPEELADKAEMSSGFVTESEIEAAKQARQEEWERVRKPDDPENAPEPEPQDNRSLFARLEEQRVAKQDEWDEAHKLKNQIRGIDDDEADFLDTVDNIRVAAEVQRRKEDAQALKEFKDSQDKLLEEEEKRKKADALGGRSDGLGGGSGLTKKTSIFSGKGGSKDQKSMLASVIKKRPIGAASSSVKDTEIAKREDSNEEPCKKSKLTRDNDGDEIPTSKAVQSNPLTSLVGDYSDSSGSDSND